MTYIPLAADLPQWLDERAATLEQTEELTPSEADREAARRLRTLVASRLMDRPHFMDALHQAKTRDAWMDAMTAALTALEEG